MSEGNYEEQPKTAFDGTKQTVRTADKRVLHRKLTPTQLEYQRSLKNNMSQNKHPLRGLGGKHESTSEKARKLEEGITSESKPTVQKVESDVTNSEFEGYDKSDDKPVHVYLDKEITEKILQLHHYRTDRQKKKQLTTVRQEVGMIILAYANPVEFSKHRNGRVACHVSEAEMASHLYAGPSRKEPLRPKPRLVTMQEINSDYNPNEDK